MCRENCSSTFWSLEPHAEVKCCLCVSTQPKEVENSEGICQRKVYHCPGIEMLSLRKTQGKTKGSHLCVTTLKHNKSLARWATGIRTVTSIWEQLDPEFFILFFLSSSERHCLEFIFTTGFSHASKSQHQLLYLQPRHPYWYCYGLFRKSVLCNLLWFIVGLIAWPFWLCVCVCACLCVLGCACVHGRNRKWE